MDTLLFVLAPLGIIRLLWWLVSELFLDVAHHLIEPNMVLYNQSSSYRNRVDDYEWKTLGYHKSRPIS